MPVRALAALLDFGLGISPPLLERIDGLVAVRPMDTQGSLKVLDMTLESFVGRT